MTDYKGPERRVGAEDRRESVLAEYFRGWIVKILANLSSAKVWFFLWPFAISSIYMGWIIKEQTLLVDEIMKTSLNPEMLNAVHNSYKVMTDSFIAWCTFQTALVGTIVVVRETFKVSKLQALRQSDNSDSVEEVHV